MKSPWDVLAISSRRVDSCGSATRFMENAFFPDRIKNLPVHDTSDKLTPDQKGTNH